MGLSLRARISKMISPVNGIRESYDLYSQMETWRWNNLFLISRAIRPLFERKMSGRVVARIVIEANR